MKRIKTIFDMVWDKEDDIVFDETMNKLGQWVFCEGKSSYNCILIMTDNYYEYYLFINTNLNNNYLYRRKLPKTKGL